MLHKQLYVMTRLDYQMTKKATDPGSRSLGAPKDPGSLHVTWFR